MNFNNIVFIIINNQNDPAISIRFSRILLSSTREISVSQLRKDFLFHTLMYFFFFSYVVESRNVDRFEISSIRENFIYHYN